MVLCGKTISLEHCEGAVGHDMDEQHLSKVLAGLKLIASTEASTARVYHDGLRGHCPNLLRPAGWGGSPCRAHILRHEPRRHEGG